MFVHRICTTVLVVATCFTLFAERVSAATFEIDSSQSSLSIVVGAYDGEDPPVFTPITTAQQLGSDVTSLNGSFVANTGGGAIEILSGAIGFNNQPTDMSPLAGGALPGAAPANYGLNILVAFPSGQVLVAGPAAARGVGADISLAPSVLVGSSFDANGALVALSSGILDVNLSGLTSIVTGVNIAGNSGLNTGGVGTYTNIGGVETLTIPVHVEALVSIEIAPGSALPFTAIFEGQIVARAVPEPSSMLLAGLGVAATGLAYRRRARR